MDLLSVVYADFGDLPARVTDAFGLAPSASSSAAAGLRRYRSSFEGLGSRPRQGGWARTLPS